MKISIKEKKTAFTQLYNYFFTRALHLKSNALSNALMPNINCVNISFSLWVFISADIEYEDTASFLCALQCPKTDKRYCKRGLLPGAGQRAQNAAQLAVKNLLIFPFLFCLSNLPPFDFYYTLFLGICFFRVDLRVNHGFFQGKIQLYTCFWCSKFFTPPFSRMVIFISGHCNARKARNPARQILSCGNNRIRVTMSRNAHSSPVNGIVCR